MVIIKKAFLVLSSEFKEKNLFESTYLRERQRKMDSKRKGRFLYKSHIYKNVGESYKKLGSSDIVHLSFFLKKDRIFGMNMNEG